MSYKYHYSYVIEGFNRKTKSLEEIHRIEQDRNIGLDHKIYKLLRYICYSEIDKYSCLMVTIVRWDLRYPVESFEYISSRRHVGMMFFDKYETFTHRSIILNTPDGKKKQWAIFNQKDETSVYFNN